MKVEYFPEAIEDIADIGNFIRGKNPEAAEKVLLGIESCCEQFAGNPKMGRSRSELGTDLRSFPHGNYVIFYRVADQVVSIARVLHSAMDIEAIFNPN